MSSEDTSSTESSTSTEKVQLALPEEDNSYLTEKSEEAYGNNQHKGEFASNAIELMRRIEEGDGVSPEFLATLGVDVGRAGWESSSTESGRKRKFSTDEKYLNNLGLDDSDSLHIDEYDYEDLVKDTYKKRIPVVAAVLRGYRHHKTIEVVRETADKMFNKHDKTIRRYIDELEQAVKEGDVAELHVSLAHLFESHEFENNNFSTTNGETIAEFFGEGNISFDVAPAWTEQMLVIDGLDGFAEHILNIVDECVERIDDYKESILGSSYISERQLSKVGRLYAFILEVSTLADDYVAQFDDDFADELSDEIEPKREEASVKINRISEHKEEHTV